MRHHDNQMPNIFRNTHHRFASLPATDPSFDVVRNSQNFQYDAYMQQNSQRADSRLDRFGINVRIWILPQRHIELKYFGPIN